MTLDTIARIPRPRAWSVRSGTHCSWLTLAAIGALACRGPDPASDGGTDTDTGSESEATTAPELAADPEIIFHPNQPMVVDVIVELDQPGELALEHDEDPGVHVASLAVEDEGRRHHLRVRGLAPDSAQPMTLTRADPDSGAIATTPLSFTTQHALSGFRLNFDLEVSDPAAVDPVYRYFDYAYTALWSPTGIFVIDPGGRVRWYYGDDAIYKNLGAVAVWAGIELRDDGTLLAVRDGAVTVLDELGETRLRFSFEDYGLSYFHHEAQQLANGNILALGNDFREIDIAGYGPTLVAADYLLEFSESGEIVWTWSAFDHLDPQRILVPVEDAFDYYDTVTEQYAYDWTHGNGMLDMPEDGLILLSMRHQDWILAIDKQSGEVVWRLGEGGDFELLAGTWFYHQHSPQWQPDGSLLLYDNGNDLSIPPEEVHSRAVRYALDFEAMTATQLWDDGEVPRFSTGGGDADRTPAGNLLILDTSTELVHAGANTSQLRELANEDPEAVWSLVSPPGTYMYRATASTRLPGEALD